MLRNVYTSLSSYKWQMFPAFFSPSLLCFSCVNIEMFALHRDDYSSLEFLWDLGPGLTFLTWILALPRHEHFLIADYSLSLQEDTYNQGIEPVCLNLFWVRSSCDWSCFSWALIPSQLEFIVQFTDSRHRPSTRGSVNFHLFPLHEYHFEYWICTGFFFNALNLV